MILHTLLSHLRSSDLDLTVVSKDPKQTKQIHKIKAVSNKWSALNRVRNTDLLIFGGGQIFNDNRFRTIPFWSSVLHFSHLINHNVKIVLLNQGFETENRLLKHILGSALSTAKLISVRDSVSFKFANGLNLEYPPFFGPDIVFSSSINEKTKSTVQKSKLKTIGVNIRPPFWWRNKSEANKYADIIASAFDLLIEKNNVDLVFVPFRLPGKEAHDDLEFSEFILSKMKQRDHARTFVCPLDDNFFSHLIGCFRGFDFFLGTTFHSLVLACKLGVPFLAFSYQKRCDVLLQDLGLNNLVIQESELSSPLSLYSRISSAIDSANDITSLLTTKIIELSKNAKKAHVEPINLCIH